MATKTDYNALRAIAEKLINKYGQAGRFIKSGELGGVDDFGNATPDVPDIVIDGTVTPLLDFGTQSMMSSYEIQGVSIQAGDKFVFFHSDTAPEIGYTHTQNGNKWRMVAMLKEVTSVDGINVFRKIQMRR